MTPFGIKLIDLDVRPPVLGLVPGYSCCTVAISSVIISCGISTYEGIGHAVSDYEGVSSLYRDWSTTERRCCEVCMSRWVYTPPPSHSRSPYPRTR